ncbi:hypothetical protein L2D08_07495 [Domibacillus sp. PGB-M46]|uniref:sigma factor-like helix-turn-helix DNA-binding protein n=1 Tax=Domibacillus sp. PGB-M46 TaxID=2910255 RepID=UPI001F57CEAE|nr:sigma factor-like helix-turn-helix DNA-binding protein [Domibacillus sp. PGB-M46]MCI2254206.1 hypothetical protein [Domibacillus sp. PGB-M46]
MKAFIEAKPELSGQDIQDKTLINGMINEVGFALQWMISGRNPDARRGVDRIGAYTLDLKLIENQAHIEERKLTAHKQWLLDDVLAELAARERDVLKAEGLTYEYTAELLGLTKLSVQTYFERAERKMKNAKTAAFFLFREKGFFCFNKLSLRRNSICITRI